METLDDETRIDEAGREREGLGTRLYEEVFTQQIELRKVVVSKTAIPELGRLFCKGNGTHFAFGHTRTNRYAHNQTGTNAGSLEKRVEEGEGRGGCPNYFISGGGGTGWRCPPLNPGSKVFRYEMELHNSLSECFINRDYSYLSPQCGRVYACCVPANH